MKLSRLLTTGKRAEMRRSAALAVDQLEPANLNR